MCFVGNEEKDSISYGGPSVIKKFIDGYGILSIHHRRDIIAPYHPCLNVICTSKGILVTLIRRIYWSKIRTSITKIKDQIPTFGNNKASKHENHEQGESTKRACNNLCSSGCCNKTEERESHLMYTKESQELLEKPVIETRICK